MAGEKCAIESEETKLYSSGEALIPKRVRPCSEIRSIAERFRWGSLLPDISSLPPKGGTYSGLLTNPRVREFALRYEF
jgi:hypothetical protein